MKKVGILTLHRAINYGAVLQAFALYSHIKSLGFDVEIIDYCPDTLKSRIMRLPKRPISLINRVLQLFKFDNFVKKYFKLSKQYTSLYEINKCGGITEYDYIICGSDQIWNVDKVGKTGVLVYLLDFFTGGSTCISYAASIGGGSKELPPPLLNKFKYLSVREQEAKKVIEPLVCIDVQHVLDPSLLFTKDFYANIMSKRLIKKRYALVLDLSGGDLLKQVTSKVKADASIMIVTTKLNGSGDKKMGSVSPNDWLSLINYADYIITDSFHGTCFSIIFQKQFYCVSKPMVAENNRAVGLLDQLNMSERFVQCIEDVDINNKVEYMDIQDKTISSKEFIINSLK